MIFSKRFIKEKSDNIITNNIVEKIEVYHKKTILENKKILSIFIPLVIISYFTKYSGFQNFIEVLLTFLFFVAVIELFIRRRKIEKNIPKKQNSFFESIFYKRILSLFLFYLIIGFLVSIMDIKKRPWLGGSFGGIKFLTLAFYIIICYLTITVIITAIRKKFFQITMNKMIGALEKGQIKEVIKSLEIESEGYTIWGLEYILIYRELVELLKLLDKEILKEELAVKERIEFITNASHDIKTPLTVIINYIDILKNREITERERIKFTENLKSKTKNFKDLVEDFKYSIALSENEFKEVKEEIEIISTLKSVIDSFKEQLEERKITIQIVHNNEEVNWNINEKLIIRIFENLINNLYKYGKRGSNAIVGVNFHSNKLIILIKNHCENYIECKEGLLEKFKRGDNAREKEGSGLGLYIVKELMEKEKGKVNLNVENNSFEVVLEFEK